MRNAGKIHTEEAVVSQYLFVMTMKKKMAYYVILSVMMAIKELDQYVGKYVHLDM